MGEGLTLQVFFEGHPSFLQASLCVRYISQPCPTKMHKQYPPTLSVKSVRDCSRPSVQFILLLFYFGYETLSSPMITHSGTSLVSRADEGEPGLQKGSGIGPLPISSLPSCSVDSQPPCTASKSLLPYTWLCVLALIPSSGLSCRVGSATCFWLWLLF